MTSIFRTPKACNWLRGVRVLNAKPESRRDIIKLSLKITHCPPDYSHYCFYEQTVAVNKGCWEFRGLLEALWTASSSRWQVKRDTASVSIVLGHQLNETAYEKSWMGLNTVWLNWFTLNSEILQQHSLPVTSGVYRRLKTFQVAVERSWILIMVAVCEQGGEKRAGGLD